MNDDDDFYLQVAFALSGCQLVEQQLKLYISEALEFARKCIGNRMPFKMDGKDYEDASLEKLIGVFKKLSNNSQLVTELSQFKNERNFLSHKGISHCLDPDGELFETAAADFQARLQDIQQEATRLRLAIHTEAGTFIGHLYFGKFPQ
jgi:hypothetical protein